MADTRPEAGRRRQQRGALARHGAAAPASMSGREVFGILSRHAILIVAMTLLGCCVGGGTWYLLRRYLPSYTAETLIAVLSPIEEDPTRIGTIQVHKNVQYDYRVSMASLIKQQVTYVELLKLDTIRRTNWFQSFAGNHNRALTYLKKYMGAYPHRDAGFVSISMTCGQSKEAAAIANTMAELFVKSRGNQKRDDISNKLVKLEEQRKQVQKEIDQINQHLDGVRKKWGVSGLSAQGAAFLYQHPIVANYNKLQLDENEMAMEVSQMQSSVENIRALATGPINEQIAQAIERDPIILTLTNSVNVRQASLAGKLTRFGESHRVVREIREGVADLKTTLEARTILIAEQTRQANFKNAQHALVDLQTRLEKIQTLREEAAKKKDDLDMARIEHSLQQVSLDERQAALVTLKENIQKWRIKLDDPQTPKVQLQGRALPPIEMTASRHALLWFPGGTLMGLMLGVALTFLVEFLNDLVRKPSDVARYLNIPLLGVVPHECEDDLPKDADLSQVVRHAPYSLISESYRRFRTNLELSGAKTLLVASGEPEEGCTSVAVNLALSLAAKSKRVVMIDGNFRQPALQTLFPRSRPVAKEAPTAYGLSNLLMGQCNIRQGLRPSGAKGLDLIDTGLLPPNPTELLASGRMEVLLAELSKVYDHIILDSSPILLVSDPKVLSRIVDATVLVCHAAYTQRGAAQRALSELARVDANVVGCVLLGVRAIRGGYFRKQYKGYHRYMEPTLAG